jgi:predicted secreted protein
MLKIFGLAVILTCCTGFLNFCQVSTPGMRIEKNVNEKFDITIEACHDAGYRWFLEPVDTTRIKLLSCTSKPVNEKFKFGGNVYETWTFIGFQRGEYQLVFNYRHPWQDKIDRTEKFTVVIN